MELSQFGALSVILLAMVLGELVSKVTKGRVPSALVISVVLILGFWTVLPADLAERAGISSGIYNICVLLLVTHLGTVISRKEMIAQWRTVLISLLGIAAICLVTLTVGSALFGWTNAVAATPTLTGAAVAATIMQSAAMAKGATTAALIAVITMVMQGLVGYPIAAFCLRRETKRLKGLYEAGNLPVELADSAENTGAGKKKFTSTTLILLKLSLLALAAYYMEKLTGGYVSKYVWCLLFGFAAHEFGILESDALTVAKSDGILMTFLLGYLFCSLSVATPEIFFPVAGITLALVVMAAAAMAIVSAILCKITRESFYMTYTIALNAFFGFPINVMLTNEAISACTDDAEIQKALSAQIMPKMLVAGFTSVTIVSVLVAGILVNFL